MNISYGKNIGDFFSISPSSNFKYTTKYSVTKPPFGSISYIFNLPSYFTNQPPSLYISLLYQIYS